MKRFIPLLLLCLLASGKAMAQLPKVYNEHIDPIRQIDSTLTVAQKSGKFVVCQVGGNWCPWCLRFADFIKKDAEIRELIEKNFEYIHVNYPRRDAAPALMQKLGNPGRFGYPVFVVMDEKGNVMHIQDSSFLEEGQGYDQKKVLRFLKCWTKEAVAGK